MTWASRDPLTGAEMLEQAEQGEQLAEDIRAFSAGLRRHDFAAGLGRAAEDVEQIAADLWIGAERVARSRGEILDIEIVDDTESLLRRADQQPLPPPTAAEVRAVAERLSELEGCIYAIRVRSSEAELIHAEEALDRIAGELRIAADEVERVLGL